MPTAAVINERFQSITSTIYTFANQSVQQVRRKAQQFSTWTRIQWRARRRTFQKYFRRKAHGSERAANYSTRTANINVDEGDNRASKRTLYEKKRGLTMRMTQYLIL
jgi:hypothetical protein